MTELHVLGEGKWWEKQARKRLKERKIQHALASKWLKEKGLWKDMPLTDIKVGDHIVVPRLYSDECLDLEVKQVDHPNNAKQLVCVCDQGLKLTIAWDEHFNKYITPEYIHYSKEGVRYIMPNYIRYKPFYKGSEPNLTIPDGGGVFSKDKPESNKPGKDEEVVHEMTTLYFWVNGEIPGKRSSIMVWLVKHFPKLFKRIDKLWFREVNRLLFWIHPLDDNGEIPTGSSKK